MLNANVKAVAKFLNENTTIYTEQECESWALRLQKHVQEKHRTIISVPVDQDTGRAFIKLVDGQYVHSKGSEEATSLLLALA